MERHSVTIKEIQIECAGRMTTMHARAPRSELEMLKSLKQFQGSKGCVQLNDPVQEGFGSGRAIQRISFMKGGDQEFALFMDHAKMADCVLDKCVSIAQIGAEGDTGTHGVSNF